MKIRGSVPYYTKIRLRSHKNIGSSAIRLPKEELHTRSYWFTFNEEMSAGCSANDMQHALLGITHVLSHLAPLCLKRDPMNIRVVPQLKGGAR
ncbi:hypothetical protein [Paenibacillus sp. V4I5]|uniref:hypothetical protein n=1 Tax=Paenibacillus sp. V4I5 TaxID=3042306 RepID=UPI00278CDE3E|nr:hypothetical protein [Paenibacillus sp. V4I5]MDQ0915427.1 hypothetical protein [Paenibacillus sp. V4I5]